jgi:hypothetical protein
MGQLVHFALFAGGRGHTSLLLKRFTATGTFVEEILSGDHTENT